jgi:endonuclease YncB( thermonuclease family)
MRTRLPLALISLVLAAATLTVTSPARAVGDMDCGDFDTQAQAQNFFNNHNPSADPHQLDGDGDGVVCESNPCPCITGGGGGGNNGGDAGTGPRVRHQRATVIRVVDGDTVEVNLTPGPNATVRLLGIDTPEVFGGVECHGTAASRATKKMLPRGTRVRLTSDPSQDLTDRYGRILRYVAKGKADVNRRLVNRGHARVYVYDNTPFKRVRAYRTAQAFAKRHHLGLWDC